MRPLRFCMLTTFYPPWSFGGDGIGIQRLVHGLLRRGHEVTVVHDADGYDLLRRGPPPEPPPPREGLRIETLRTGRTLVSPLLTQQLGRPVLNARRIRRILDEGRFDVINFHNVSLVGGPGLLSYGEGVKLYMAHEHWLVCPTHVLWRHRRERCDRRECVRCQLRYRRPPQLWRHTGRLQRQLRHVDTFIAMSRFSRDKHREFGFPREMEVLPYFLENPASRDGVPPEPEGASPHPRPYFLFVGRLERIKGLDEVIPLFRDYRDADLVIAGDGEHAAHLRELAAGIDGVRFLGRVPLGELGRWYRHALALVVPSVCFETFGIILIEAFREGTPVIARRLGPFPEIVETAGAGSLFDTPGELLAAMRALAADPERRARERRAGWRAFVDHWTEDAVLPRYLDLVGSAAEARGLAEVAAIAEEASHA